MCYHSNFVNKKIKLKINKNLWVSITWKTANKNLLRESKKGKMGREDRKIGR